MNKKPIIELTNGIILAEYQKDTSIIEDHYQTEKELEERFIRNLESQGYERLNIHNNDELRINLRKEMERLNKIKFNDSEWNRFCFEFLDKQNDGKVEKTQKIQTNHRYSFEFDNGEIKNLQIIDKNDIFNNKLQVINQFEQEGLYKNRYDVTILVNGLPLVQIELKKRGVSLQEAFAQINRYQKESFNEENSLYKYVQIFVISNGTKTKYFANTTKRDKANYEFCCEWADARNNVITDLVDFTKTFFEKRVLLEILTKYCIFDTQNNLLIMRPYQIAATERILFKIKNSYEAKLAGTIDAGGFIWHTTGSGKTITSFKTAKLATELDFIDKVFFVVDRKDLDYQTMKEYKKFDENSVIGSKNTNVLKKSIENANGKIIVTTIQKLNEFVKKNPKHEIFEKQCVLIYDECHRSQFGESQNAIKKAFKNYYQFGFTGTPIFVENSITGATTASIFGAQLHSYIITDAIRDGKVLKFKVDYNNVSADFKKGEQTNDLEELKKLEKKMLMHPDRISKIVSHILSVYNTKTHRNEYYSYKDKYNNGFNAMFCVESVDAAKLYYEEFQKQQKNLSDDKRLKIGTIFSFEQNEVNSIGEINDESFETNALSLTSKEFLQKVVDDYNEMFNTSFTIDNNGFENYYKDISIKTRYKELDILIVVGMFLTGFDAPTLNTLFVDKNLRYHGLIQAFSRTNRICNKTKTFGNIVCFRDLEKATKDAIQTFGDKNSVKVILEKSYEDYMNGYANEETNEINLGYNQICQELIEKFPDPTEIILDKDKKEFVKLFGEVLKLENILRNYDEFSKADKIISPRLMQDMRSVYVDINEDFIKRKDNNEKIESQIDFSDVEFQIELLKTDEINLDYILELILEKSKESNNLENIKQEIRRVIRANLGVRAKEELIIDFIENNNLNIFNDKTQIIESFYKFARIKKEKMIKQMIENENLKNQNNEANEFIEKSIKKGYVETHGTELNNILPNLSRRGGMRKEKKEKVYDSIKKIVDIFIGI